MRAAVYYETGGPDVFRYEDVPDPVGRDGGVVIDVEAISIEGGDTLNRGGGAMTSTPDTLGLVQGIATDAATQKVLPNAKVTIGSNSVNTDSKGAFTLAAAAGTLALLGLADLEAFRRSVFSEDAGGGVIGRIVASNLAGWLGMSSAAIVLLAVGLASVSLVTSLTSGNWNCRAVTFTQ